MTTFTRSIHTVPGFHCPVTEDHAACGYDPGAFVQGLGLHGIHNDEWHYTLRATRDGLTYALVLVVDTPFFPPSVTWVKDRKIEGSHVNFHVPFPHGDYEAAKGWATYGPTTRECKALNGPCYDGGVSYTRAQDHWRVGTDPNATTPEGAVGDLFWQNLEGVLTEMIDGWLLERLDTLPAFEELQTAIARMKGEIAEREG